MVIDYAEQQVALGDGTEISLRSPTYSVTDLAYGPMHPDAMLSPRVAPPMTGLGLLEAVAEADILLKVDPDDSVGDGISGRANFVLVSSPEGNSILAIDAATASLVSVTALDDGCGIAPDGTGFLASSGQGELIGLAGSAAGRQTLGFSFDNHLRLISRG